MSVPREPAATAPYWRYAAILAVTAMACGALLGGLSAWFLGSVAIAGLTTAAFTFNFHIPGALVRLFAIGRTVARYGERLAGHKAALTDQVERRIRLFGAMASAPGVRSAGWQLADQSRLADYLDDVEDIDFARLRASLPLLSMLVAGGGGLIATLMIAPLALLPILLLLIAVLAAASRTAQAGAMAWGRARTLRRESVQRLGSAMASAVPLQAERRWRSELAAALAPFAQADGEVLALRRMQSGLDAIASLLGPLAAISVIASAWIAGARGSELLIPIFLAFAWLTLGEPLQNASRIVVASLRRTAAEASVNTWQAAGEDTPPAPAAAPMMLAHPALQRRAPDGRPLGKAVSLRLEAGRPTVLTGPSGAGKTSLLKQIAGWIGEDALRSDVGTLQAAARRALAAFCLHDAAILADTVRANLFAPAASDHELWQALKAVELEERVRQAGGLDGWITQDALSLGEAQRLNLARAWLSPLPLVLLDEPTEHLDAAQAARILNRLTARLEDRIVVMSSHRATGLEHIATLAL